MQKQGALGQRGQFSWDPGEEYEVLDKLVYQHGKRVWETPYNG